MPKLFCVYSTLANDNRYVTHKQSSNEMAVEVGSVLVKGGAGVLNDRIVTPRGVATMVTEDEAKLLRNNSHFKLHETNGFVRLEEVQRPPSTESADAKAADMEGRDASAPMVPQDFSGGPGNTAPTAGTATAKA